MEGERGRVEGEGGRVERGGNVSDIRDDSVDGCDSLSLSGAAALCRVVGGVAWGAACTAAAWGIVGRGAVGCSGRVRWSVAAGCGGV